MSCSDAPVAAAPAALGQGAKVYIPTWGCDSEDLAMATATLPFAIGGDEPGQSKVMDASAVIVLP